MPTQQDSITDINQWHLNISVCLISQMRIYIIIFLPLFHYCPLDVCVWGGAVNMIFLVYNLLEREEPHLFLGIWMDHLFHPLCRCMWPCDWVLVNGIGAGVKSFSSELAPWWYTLPGSPSLLASRNELNLQGKFGNYLLKIAESNTWSVISITESWRRLENSDCNSVMVYMESMIWFDVTTKSMKQLKTLQRDFAAFLYVPLWCFP